MNLENSFANITVEKLEEGYRLDLFLSFKLPHLSRSLIKKLIEHNKILVNGVACFKPAYKVKVNDVISYPIKYLQQDYKENLTNNYALNFDFDLLYEDEDYLVINKPIGVKVHRTSTDDTEPSLIDALNYLHKFKLPGGGIRPGIVHRLDKGTSGVFIVAKNPKALWWLSKQFAERKVNKYYISIGISLSNIKLDQKYIKVEGYIRRSLKNRKMFVLENNKNMNIKENLKYSLSYFYPLEVKFIDNVYLIFFLIEPKTGRTHQIRVHQKFLGMPILGDDLYLSSKLLFYSHNIISQFKNNFRLFLHAYALRFYNYDGTQKFFTANIPNEFLIFFSNAEEKINTFEFFKT